MFFQNRHTTKRRACLLAILLASCVGSAAYAAMPAISRALPEDRAGASAPAPVPAPAAPEIVPPAPAPALPMAEQIPILPPGPEAKGDDAPVHFASAQLAYDDAGQRVIATGDVEFEQNGRILKANQVTYNLTDDVVTAEGDVSLLEANGDVHFADRVQFTDDMKDGFVDTLRSTLADGSRFTAERGRRKGGTKIIMEEASYTPCEPCKLDPSKPPLWALKADKVTHDQEDKSIAYNNATFEMGGVPVFYTPYFSHPDGTEDQKSGFLAPSFQFSDEQGFGVENNYYWAISPSTDATIGTRVFTEQTPLGLAEVRHRFQDANLVLSGSFTNSERPGYEDEGEKTRGHLFGEGLWNINEKWRAGFDAELSSDDQYLRQYDFTSDRVLENDLYVERFSGRNYASGRLLSFNDTRVRDVPVDQPDILPEVGMSFYGEPNALLGGRWEAHTSALGLQRSGAESDMYRASQELAWQGEYITPFGLVNTLTTSARGDAYQLYDLSGIPEDENSDTVTRAYTYAELESSLPFEKPTDFGALRVEPVAAVMFSPDLDDDRVTNEDSQDAQIDASNIFEANRFPGYDKVEDSSHATYGLRTGAYGGDGSMGEVFLGQSYRFDDNPLFQEGTGLSDQASDIVGQISGRYRSNAALYYRFQLDPEDMRSERHELDGNLNVGRLTLDSTYLYANALEDTEIVESREQISALAGFMLTDEWRIRAGGIYDLGEEDEGLRRSIMGLDYLGQCLTLAFTAQRRLTVDETGENNLEFFLRIGFKNLGEFGTGSSVSSLQQERDD
jgi:LPS-assembly protein